MSDYSNLIKEKIKAQEEFCENINSPFYGPRNGICWCCGKQIFAQIDINMASTEIITRCPYCSRSYVS
jgi:hypothetical protein